MKKLLAGVVALFVVYSGLWFYGSRQAKEYTDQKWNEFVKKADERGYELTKQGSTLTGFPFGYKLEIQSPSIRPKVESENAVTSNLDGTVTIKSNLFGNRYTVGSSGEQHFYISDDKEPQHYILSGDLSLAFDLPNKNFLEGVKKPFKNLMDEQANPEPAKLVHSDSVLKINNLKFIDADIPTLNVVEIEKGYLESDFTDRGEEQRITLKGDFKGFDMLFGGADPYTPGENRSLQEVAVMLSIPKAGKNDVSFSLDFIGPLDQLSQINEATWISEGIPPFTLTVNSFKTSNDFFSTDSEGKFFAKKRDNEGQKFHVSGKSIHEVTAKQEARFREQWENFLNNLPICEDKFDSDVCVSAKNIVPSWDKQGKLIYSIDMDYDLKNPENPLAGSALVVKNFDLYTDLYGFKSHGDVILKDPSAPKATYLIELPNYQNLVKDMFSYFNGIRGLLPALAPELKEVPPLNDDQFENTIEFLKSISDAPKDNKENLMITIHVNGLDKVTIGTLNAMEFAMKVDQFFQQFKIEKNQTKQEKLPEGT